MTKLSIRDRLINWALYVRVTEKQGISPTGRFLEQLKRNAGQWGYEDEAGPRREIDEVDGNLVELAMRKCSQATRDFLKLDYVWRANKGFICRRLGIAFLPKTVFELRRYHAETEIERVLEARDVGMSETKSATLPRVIRVRS